MPFSATTSPGRFSARNNMTDTARILGLHRSNLSRKMKLLGMEPP
jgi:DNA-binding NtrC family response regulator